MCGDTYFIPEIKIPVEKINESYKKIIKNKYREKIWKIRMS